MPRRKVTSTNRARARKSRMHKTSVGVPRTNMTRIFAEVVDGLEDLAAEELQGLGASSVVRTRGGLRIEHAAPLSLAGRLRSVAALYLELRFAVPRPKALLGDETKRMLVATLLSTARGGSMNSFRFAAAGADSPVFRRLADELGRASGLYHDPDAGELLVRVRPYGDEDEARAEGGRDAAGGWEVLLRLTERPLSTRSWRVCNRPGGVNATVAFAMNELLREARDGSVRGSSVKGALGGVEAPSYLNLMCGSGTLLVERALSDSYSRLVGVDIQQEAVDCARANLEAAGVERFELLTADVAALPGELAGGFTELSADAPWGDAVGSHRENEELYRALFTSAARLAAPGAHFALLSHEIKLLDRLLPALEGWRVVSSRRVSHGGHRPSLTLLERV